MKKILILFLSLTFSATFAQVLLEEDFNYVAGTELITNNWNLTGTSTTNPILVAASGLSKVGYPYNSGNAVALGATGSDVNRGFNNGDSVSTGSVYAAFLVKFTSVTAAGDYFLHLGIATNNSSIFLGRVYAKLDAGNIAFGLAKSSTNTSILPVYTAGSYSLDSTHLLVLKYTFLPEATDDEVRLFINPNLNAPEPAANLMHDTTSATGTDAITIKTVNLRQGGSTSGPVLTLDGIRVSTSWNSIVPVELTSFTANTVGKNVTLNWVTATETNNSGFSVEMAKKGGAFSAVTFVPGKGTTVEQQIYSYTVSNLASGAYQFRLKQVDFDGTSTYSNIVETEINSVSRFALDQNYPNPFNPSTTISFSIPEDANVTLKLYNVMGSEVKTLVNKRMSSGSHTLSIDVSDLAAGVYLYQLTAGSYTSTKKLTLLK